MKGVVNFFDYFESMHVKEGVKLVPIESLHVTSYELKSGHRKFVSVRGRLAKCFEE